MTSESITCPSCGTVSYNLHDVMERYCGHCHRFHDEMAGLGAYTLEAWTCDECGAVYAEYVNGCPRCWANEERRAKVTLKGISTG